MISYELIAVYLLPLVTLWLAFAIRRKYKETKAASCCALRDGGQVQSLGVVLYPGYWGVVLLTFGVGQPTLILKSTSVILKTFLHYAPDKRQPF